MADTCKPNYPRASGIHSRNRPENRPPAWGWGVLLLVLCVLWGGGEYPCWGQEKPNSQVLFLVARRSILDPFFEKSVVLMLPIKGDPLIVGLIINKPTRLPLLKLFPNSPTLKAHPGTAYMGGPVDMSTPALAFHAPKPPKDALPLYGDVFLSFDPKLIEKLLREPNQSGDLRLFLGRAQWAPEQLQGEALQGSWYSLRAEGDTIFDRDPEHLWDRLHERARPPSSVENRMTQPCGTTNPGCFHRLSPVSVSSLRGSRSSSPHYTP